jgi:hypothetical protein
MYFFDLAFVDHLRSIFIMAVGRILRNSQQCILLCSSHRDPYNFWPKWIS